MPLLSRTFPSGANKTMNKIRMYVFRCKPGESFIRLVKIYLTGCLALGQSPGSEMIRFLLCFFYELVVFLGAWVFTDHRATLQIREVQLFRKLPITFFLPWLPRLSSTLCSSSIPPGASFANPVT